MKWLLILFCVNTVTSYFCYWNSGCPYKYFSDKTPYNNVRGDIRDSIVKLKGCEPISIWALITSGKSLPDNFPRSLSNSIAIRNDVTSSYQQGKSSICAQDIENLQSWSADNTVRSKNNFLTDKGTLELAGIAKRLLHAFPKLLQNLKGNYKIAHVGGLTEECAKSFVKGLKKESLTIVKASENLFVSFVQSLLEQTVGILIANQLHSRNEPKLKLWSSFYDFTDIAIRQKVRTPYKNCKNHQVSLQNQNLLSDVEKYKKTAEYLATKDRIQRRLGIEYRLSDESVKSLYDLCRYTWSGIANKFSPWCALFTTEDLRALEYLGDLELYYKYGYGNPINGLLGRIPMADLLKTFQEAKEGKGNNFTAYFTDVATLNMVATALDLFKDKSPLSVKRDPKRKWRNTKLSGFSANLIAVLNRCSSQGDVDHNIVFYWNEEPLLPICEGGFCNWEEFQYKLNPFVNTTLAICN